MTLPFDHVVDAAQLADLYRQPNDLTQRKVIDYLDEGCKSFLAASPYVLIGSSSTDGKADVSPKGGPYGFVKALDEHRLAIPDLSGNNLLDSIQNIIENPDVGLLFLIPGRGESLRINGKAYLTTDPAILDSFTDELRRPKAAIGVQVEAAYLHCAKSIRRSGLWESDRWHDSADSSGKILKTHMGLDDWSPEDMQARLEASYEEDLALD
ncbi:MAG: MSMEG_1061 family FMN-dependent PPOX-type flavoprotein [Acidimicrobiales bacterium]